MLYQQIAKNKRKTVYVMLGFILLVALIGAGIGYSFFGSSTAGIILALIIALVYMLIMLSQSADVVMAMNHGQEITSPDQAPELWHMVEDMAMVAQIPMLGSSLSMIQVLTPLRRDLIQNMRLWPLRAGF